MLESPSRFSPLLPSADVPFTWSLLSTFKEPSLKLLKIRQEKLGHLYVLKHCPKLVVRPGSLPRAEMKASSFLVLWGSSVSGSLLEHFKHQLTEEPAGSDFEFLLLPEHLDGMPLTVVDWFQR